MCHFITATVPGDADLTQVRAIVAAHRLGFQKLTNLHIQPQLPPGDQYLGLTRKLCDCGTVLGCLHQKAENTAERAPDRFRRKGWSEARIGRWITECGKGQEKRARDRGQTREERTAEAQGWIDFLQALLSLDETAHVGLLLHWYRSGPADERFTVARTDKVRVGELTPEWLMQIEEDVLYLYVR
jgi:hypothetical protein